MNQELINEITEWAMDNFSPELSREPYRLFEFSPVTGIGEELGEFVEAHLQSQRFDAAGDVLVYLCNFCGMVGVTPEFHSSTENVIFEIAFVHYARIQHLALKHAQCIRNFADRKPSIEHEPTPKFVKEIGKEVQLFYEAFVGYAAQFGIDANEALAVTWSKLVSKRNWKKDRESATVGA